MLEGLALGTQMQCRRHVCLAVVAKGQNNSENGREKVSWKSVMSQQTTFFRYVEHEHGGGLFFSGQERAGQFLPHQQNQATQSGFRDNISPHPEPSLIVEDALKVS